jgi:enoyl-CoA hydratase
MITAKVRRLENIQVLQLTLDSEGQGNSLGSGEAKALTEHLQKFKADALLLMNEGNRFFCTGGNIKEQKSSKKAPSLKTQKIIRECLSIIANLPVPTVAIVRGDAFGGGSELLSAFDYVCAAPHVQIGLWQRKLGVTFGWGGGTRLLGRLGDKKMKNAFIAAQVFSSYEAERAGLVDEIATLDLIEEKAEAWLLKAARLPKESLKAFRKWNPKTESKIFESLWFQKDHLEILKNV